jgi:sRNA-binding carbon storage regulator CsrA
MDNVKGSLLLTRKDGENIIIEVNGERVIINLEKSTNGKAKIAPDSPFQYDQETVR